MWAEEEEEVDEMAKGEGKVRSATSEGSETRELPAEMEPGTPLSRISSMRFLPRTVAWWSPDEERW